MNELQPPDSEYEEAAQPVLVIETKHETVDSKSRELEEVKGLQPPDSEYEEAAQPVLVIETKHETVDSESRELEEVKGLRPPDLEYEEAAQPQPVEVLSICGGISESQLIGDDVGFKAQGGETTHLLAADGELNMEEGGKTDLDAEVQEYLEVDKHYNLAEGLEDAGIASTHLANGDGDVGFKAQEGEITYSLAADGELNVEEGGKTDLDAEVHKYLEADKHYNLAEGLEDAGLASTHLANGDGDVGFKAQEGEITYSLAADGELNVEEGGKTDLDAEVHEYLEVDKNYNLAEGLEDAGIASTSTHLANGDGARQTEINFGSLKCFIPSSGSHHSEETSGFTNKIFSYNSEENASTVPAYNNIEACDEAVSFEENITDEASMSSTGGSNVDTMDSQIINPEKGKSFHYLVRLPKYDDGKLREQIRLAEKELEVQTRKRDAVVVEYREKKGACIESKKNRDAARSEEKASRDLVRAKRQEIDRAQTLMNRAKNAMTFEDAASRIINMEHRIEHETLPLNEEKQLIREIKQLKQMCEQLSSNRSKMQDDQQALDQREQIEEQLKVLRKEMDTLRERLSRAEAAARAAKKKFDDETALLNDSNSKLSAANDIRQEAYINLINLKNQWKRKNMYFHSYRDDVKVARDYAVDGDKEALERHCTNQVEKFMELWNKDDEFRRSYVGCNARSTLKRLGTLDGRSLGPNDQELPSLSMISNDRLNALEKVDLLATTSDVEPNVAVDLKAAIHRAGVEMVVEQKNRTSTARKTSKPTPPPKNGFAEASRRSAEIDGENQKKEQRKEEDDLARKTPEEEEEMASKAEEESRRREEEAARLKQQKCLEEKAKAEAAKERNRKKAEKAKARAEFKAMKEAEEKEKEREKRARKKEKKKGASAETIAGYTTESEAAAPHSKPPPPAETTVDEPETKESVTAKRPRIMRSQYAKHNKIIRSLPPPPAPLRNRSKRWVMKQLIMWVLVIAVITLVLFIIGNNPNSLLYRLLSFGSTH
ncbi:hypothetical protein Dimus_013045 [Dionaea muscipula]